jgi:tRNA A-37 threonylcarbamoyl transferase component Bud32
MSAHMPEDRAHRVRCPHCGNRIQLVEPEPREVVCDSCGSSFKLDPNATTSHRPDKLPERVGRFAVLDRLGRGAFGTVYRARDPDLDREVAVKVPRAGSFATAEEEARFLREARSAAQLSHPSIVSIYEVAADGEAPAIVGELVDGPTLADRLTAGRPTFRESAELIAALADALDYAHRNGVVHRDVKPSNVLLAGGSRPKLADFGLARKDGGEITVTLDGQVLGTPAYMAPEQAAGAAAVDGRADVYSLGVILYELLTGELPFRGNARMLLHQVLHDDPKPPRRINDTIPRDLETVTLKAMAKSAGKRYSTAGDLAADLRRWLEGKPVQARPTGRVEKAWRWVKRNRAVSALLVAVILVLTAGAITSSIFAVRWKDSAGKLEAELRQSERREGELAVERGVTLAERGEVKEGLLWMARGLDMLERSGGSEEERWYARMSLSAWGQHLRPHRPPLGQRLGEWWNASPTPVFFSDGKSFLCSLFATGDEFGRFDTETGRLIRNYPAPAALKRPDSSYWSWEFHTARDGRSVASKIQLNWRKGKDEESNEVIVVWDAETGALRREIERNSSSWDDWLWSPGLKHVMSWDKTGLRIWDLTSNRSPVSADPDLPQPDGIRSYWFAPDDSLLMIRWGGTVSVWDANNGRRLCTIESPKPEKPDVRDSLRTAAFSPDGREVLTGSSQGGVHRWDARTGRLVGQFRADGEVVYTLKFDANGRWVIAYETDREIEGATSPLDSFSAWEWPTGRTWPHAYVHPDTVSPDGKIGVRRARQLVDLQTGFLIGPQLPDISEVIGYDRNSRFLVCDEYDDFIDGKVIQCRHSRSGRPIGPGIASECEHFDDERNRLAVLTWVSSKGSPEMGVLEHWFYLPVEGTPERITLWAQVLTGMELDASGVARPLDAATLAERKRRLDELGGPPPPLRN